MLLTISEFTEKAHQISQEPKGHIGFDWETTGLNPRKGARAFILGFTDVVGNKFCCRVGEGFKEALQILLSNPNIYVVPHSEKFERRFLLHQFGIRLLKVWDSETMARLAYNNHKSYSLQNCALREGLTKHEPMLAWLKQRGNKDQYHKAPPEIIEPYVEQDAWLSWELCRRQQEIFRDWDRSSTVPIREVVALELRTAPHLFDMEETGLLVDVNYCLRALKHEEEKVERARAEFLNQTQVPFVDSRKTLQPVFDSRGVAYSKTELGNASFTAESLRDSKSDPVVRAVLEYRDAKKRASSYWSNFIELEHNGIIHPQINQNRAVTGRMSISDPSCQNWPTDDDDPVYPVRRAFIARPDSYIVSLDYSQMELRLICDEAQDKGMIDAIKNGTDFHQETANAAGVPRSLAKNGRFAKLYGAGPQRVADTLGIDLALSRKICDALDESSPEVTRYSYDLIRHLRTAKFGYDFLGRRFYFDRGFEYKYPNSRIQGGCGEILRVAICDVGDFIRQNRKSPDTATLIPIHDELVLNVHKADLGLIPVIRELMIAAHRSKKTLDMDVSIHIGENFHDLRPFDLRDYVQEARDGGSAQAAENLVCQNS